MGVYVGESFRFACVCQNLIWLSINANRAMLSSMESGESDAVPSLMQTGYTGQYALQAGQQQQGQQVAFSSALLPIIWKEGSARGLHISP